MTTVGYGDKAPKSIPARLFSILWILIGIIAFGLLTGQLTGAIIKANSPPPEDMKGKDVGALRYRDYDAYVVSQNGGNLKWNDDVSDFRSDVLQLITKLQERKIHGFVLDKWTLNYATSIFNGSIDEIREAGFFFKGTTRVEKTYKGKDLSYGILINQRDDYEYFKDFVQGNQLLVSITDSQDWNEIKKEDEEAGLGKFYSAGQALLLSPSKPYFQYTMIAVAVMLVTIVLFGISYELKRKSYICKSCGRVSAAT